MFRVRIVDRPPVRIFPKLTPTALTVQKSETILSEAGAVELSPAIGSWA